MSDSYVMPIGSTPILGVTNTSYSIYLKHPEWSIGFQNSPEYKVVLSGRKPTREELVEVIFSNPLLQVILVDIIWAIVNTMEWKK